jgi:hypothetical protein
MLATMPIGGLLPRFLEMLGFDSWDLVVAVYIDILTTSETVTLFVALKINFFFQNI